MRMKIITILLCFIITFLISCGTKIDIKKIREYADPMTENLLIGRNKRNYEIYSKDFSDEMKKAVTKEKFLENCNLIEGKIGKYIEQSKKFSLATRQDKYIIVTYKGKFTEESSDVTIRIVFEEIDGVMKITGEWYDSPKLRK
ncbi:MAG: DUF3887 domain-containing protein [Caldisericia bacterium]|nr:DUF3887 domain-containing protein [Caldisericia bacterium]